MSDKKVLVADDEIHIVQVVAIKLRNNGFEVVTADNGSNAFDLLSVEKPDIVITDYQMPVMSGLELIEKMRTCPEFAKTPVIMLTARDFAIEPEVIERLNISACLSKPFSPREVLQNIEEALGQKVSS